MQLLKPAEAAQCRGGIRGPPGGRGDRRRPRDVSLPAESRDALVDLMIRFASNAEFSKVRRPSDRSIEEVPSFQYGLKLAFVT